MSIARTRLGLPSIVSETFIPRTPEVSRPIARTLSSLNRDALPERETMRISSSPLVSRTWTSSSPSRTLIAMIPSARIGVLYCVNSVFLTRPPAVANARYLPSLKSRVGITAITFSPSRSGSTLTSALPRDAREPSGSS